MTKARDLAVFNAAGVLTSTSNLNATKLTSGTIPNARYGTPTFNGSNLTGIEAGGENTPAFRAYLGSSQGSCAAGANTTILLDSVDHDTDSAFANNKFTVPAGKAGKYLLYGSVQTNSSEDFDDYQAVIFKNSTTGIARQRLRHHYADNANVTTTAVLAVGDTIELKIYNGSNTSKTVFGDTQGTFLGGFKLAE